jgi:hypothetical protein
MWAAFFVLSHSGQLAEEEQYFLAEMLFSFTT